jgi:hypothetical protein
MGFIQRILAALAAGAILLLGGAADAADRHAGYYYPEPTSIETYVARAGTLPRAGREMRIGFVTGMTAQQLSASYPPPFAIFAKGEQAQKLLIVSLSDNGFHTLFQARALLAQLTSVARASDLFRDMGVEDFFTFFDLAKLLGFELITISDGDTFAHQVLIE